MEFNNNYLLRIKHKIKDAIFNKLDKMLRLDVCDLDIYALKSKEPIAFSKDLLDKKKYKPIKVGDSFGKLFDCAWFIIEGKIPNYNKNDIYYLSMDFNGELLLFSPNGEPLKGFTNGSSVFDRGLGEPGKYDYEINNLINPDGSVSFLVDGAANDLFGFLSDGAKIKYCKIIKKSDELFKLYYDLEFLYDLMMSDLSDEKYSRKLLDDLDLISNLIIYEESNLLEVANNLIKKYLENKTKSNISVYSIGHAHMDLAWLWPVRETKRKIARNLSNVIYLIEKYPGFNFGISQPQQLKWLKNGYPSLYEKVKKYISEGRIEPQGGMWVEADTNISGEEALVRQMLHGVKFFQDEFNFRVKNLWLPDVFGYSGNIPQIMKKSGLDYFMTIKLSWNLVNVFPYKSFIWEGIDKSKIIAHMPPEGTYNSATRPSSLLDGVKKYPEKEISPLFLNVFGIGDGGGGPGEEHVQRIIREKDIYPLAKNNFSRSDIFFEELKKYEDKLPKFSGELYFENHQGCYTSAPNNKKYNRLLEEKLRSLEVYLSLNDDFDKYNSEIKEIWEEVLLYQFHDILPGSSIMRVYEESEKRYQILSKRIDEISSNLKNTKYFFNPNLYQGEKIEKKDNEYLVYNMNPLSTNSDVISYKKDDNRIDLNDIRTSNLKIKISDSTGQILSIYNNLTNTELLTKPEGNKLSVYKDFGNGWDICDNYRFQTPKTATLVSQEVSSYDRFIEIINNYEFLNSTILERVLIDTEKDLIYFYHDTNLQDMKYMLRTSFPVNVDTDDCYFDIQFGHLKRKRNENSNITKAQYEMCGYKWIMLSDDKNKVGLINKSKYGFYTKNGVLDINLVRSSDYPGKTLGIGKTDYSYIFAPIKSDDPLTEIDRLANCFNTYYLPVCESYNYLDSISLDNEKIILSAFKMSYDGKSHIIRLYNPTSKVQKAKFNINKKCSEIKFCNLVEEDLDKEFTNNLKFDPFEIITIKIK